MATSKPVILVVQGAYQTSDFYSTFEEKLKSRGFDVQHPELPTCSNPQHPDFPTKTISDDAKAVKDQINPLISAGREIVVFAHSYGGLAASEAIAQTDSKQDRGSRGLSGGISSIIFCAGFALQEGTSVIGTFGVSVNDEVQPDGRNTFKDAESKLFSDLSPSERKIWAARTIPHSYRVQKYEMTNAAWRFIPTIYIVLDHDRCVPPQGQEMMACMIGAKVEHFKSGHEAFLSRPDDLSVKTDQLVHSIVL